MDDAIVYAGGMAALRIRFSYRFTRTIGSDVLAYREVHLFGDALLATYDEDAAELMISRTLEFLGKIG